MVEDPRLKLRVYQQDQWPTCETHLRTLVMPAVPLSEPIHKYWQQRNGYEYVFMHIKLMVKYHNDLAGWPIDGTDTLSMRNVLLRKSACNYQVVYCPCNAHSRTNQAQRMTQDES